MSLFHLAYSILYFYVFAALCTTGIVIYGFVKQEVYPSFSEYFFQSTLKSWLLMLCVSHPWFFAISTFGFTYAQSKEEQKRISCYSAVLISGFNLFALHPYFKDRSSFSPLHYMVASLVLLWSLVHVVLSIVVGILLLYTNNNIEGNYIIARYRRRRRLLTDNDKISVGRSMNRHGTDLE